MIPDTIEVELSADALDYLYTILLEGLAEDDDCPDEMQKLLEALNDDAGTVVIREITQ